MTSSNAAVPMPGEWTLSTVGTEFEVKLGKMLDSQKNVGVLKPYLGNRSVQWNRIDTTDLPLMAMSHQDLIQYRLKRGDLLVCEGGEVGRAAIWNEELPECYYQKALHRLRPTKNFNGRLMLEFLRYWSDRRLLANYVTQTSIAHLTREKLLEIPLPFPPLPEQRAIAEALSDVDDLINSLDKLIAKKRAIKQATMQQLLTGKTRLPGFSGEWVLRSIGELTEVTMGQSPDSKNYNSSGIGLPLLQGNADIKNYRSITRLWTSQVTKKCKEGDLLLTVRAPVGAIALASAEACLGRGICALSPKSIEKMFLFFYLQFFESKWSDFEQGSTFTAVNSNEIRSFTIYAPNDPKEQSEISEILSDIDEDINSHVERLKKASSLKYGMMHELLTGKTRLI